MTTFKRSTKLYKLAMSYNRALDRDKDGIACEKAWARAMADTLILTLVTGETV